ncbi:hypothetical protein D9M68_967050 [compost metagenome]
MRNNGALLVAPCSCMAGLYGVLWLHVGEVNPLRLPRILLVRRLACRVCAIGTKLCLFNGLAGGCLCSLWIRVCSRTLYRWGIFRCVVCC